MHARRANTIAWLGILLTALFLFASVLSYGQDKKIFKPLIRQRLIQLDVFATPESVSPGQKTSITVTARDVSNNPLSDADVDVVSGGGKFLQRADEKYDPRNSLQSPYTASGKTDEMGCFTTWWVCNPCAAGYVLEIKVRKNDYLDAKSEVTIKIR